MKSETVVVFGGSGFLGSHVADALSQAGFHVKIFDNRPSQFLKNDQEMLVGDILDLEACVKACSGCSVVYNFAGLADIDEAKGQPIRAVKLNILGNIHALEAARLAKAKRFIFASTVYVFSASGSFYRVTKQSSEKLVEAYQERYGLNFTILRYGSLYGRRADHRNGIFRFLKQAMEEKVINYGGSPEAMREYIHVSDAARLSVEILGEEYINKHIILTGNERMPVKNLFKMISEMLPEPISIIFSPQNTFGHYDMTPYAFQPQLGRKLISNHHVDIGQGLLDCMNEIHEMLHQKEHKEVNGDWLVIDQDLEK